VQEALRVSRYGRRKGRPRAAAGTVLAVAARAPSLGQPLAGAAPLRAGRRLFAACGHRCELCSGRLCWQASASLRKRRKELEAAQQNESKKLSNLEEARGALGAAGCSADGGPRGPLRPLHGSLR
jgi:hypothetical protein